MMDLVEIVKQVGYSLEIGYWFVEIERRIVYWPKGLGRPAHAPGATGYQAGELDKIIAMIDGPDQGRFRAFLTDILHADGADRVIELTVNSSWGARIEVRLAGRRVGHGKEARIIGLLEVIDRWKKSERLAKSLGFIVEALFISSDSGIVIFDSGLHVRRLNRNALDLFGITEADEADGSYSAALEAKLPQNIRALLEEAIESSSAVSGTLALGGLGASRLTWRANPWGDGQGEMSGIVMVFNPKRLARAADLVDLELRAEVAAKAGAQAAKPTLPPPPAARHDEAPDRRHRALEWVKHPIVLVSISTGEIAFANRAARELYRLPAGKRCFVENVYDVSGFTCDPDPVTIVEAGGHLLRLKLGARVGRMFDYDDDLLFIEYHADVAHPRPQPRPAATAVPTAAVAR